MLRVSLLLINQDKLYQRAFKMTRIKLVKLTVCTWYQINTNHLHTSAMGWILQLYMNTIYSTHMKVCVCKIPVAELSGMLALHLHHRKSNRQTAGSLLCCTSPQGVHSLHHPDNTKLKPPAALRDRTVALSSGPNLDEEAKATTMVPPRGRFDIIRFGGNQDNTTYISSAVWHTGGEGGGDRCRLSDNNNTFLSVVASPDQDRKRRPAQRNQRGCTCTEQLIVETEILLTEAANH